MIFSTWRCLTAQKIRSPNGTKTSHSEFLEGGCEVRWRNCTSGGSVGSGKKRCFLRLSIKATTNFLSRNEKCSKTQLNQKLDFICSRVSQTGAKICACVCRCYFVLIQVCWIERGDTGTPSAYSFALLIIPTLFYYIVGVGVTLYTFTEIRKGLRCVVDAVLFHGLRLTLCRSVSLACWHIGALLVCSCTVVVLRLISSDFDTKAKD